MNQQHDNSQLVDLQIEKIFLEIEELKGRLTKSKKEKTWADYIKPIIPVMITLIIAIGGWIITVQFNSSQLIITESRNNADKEIAQINASLSFIKLMGEIPDSNIQLRQYSKTVIAPALPPESSFYIAVDEVRSNPFILEVLMRTYPDNYWNYLTPYFEAYPLYFKFDPFRKPTDDLPLLAFIDRKGLLDDFYRFATSEEYSSSNRVFSLINYFDYLYEKEELTHNPAKNNEIKYLLLSTIEKTTDVKLKADISLSASLVFDIYADQGYGTYSKLAAKYYWDNFDVSIGEIPKEGSVENIVYLKRFGRHDESEKHYKLPAIDALSESLFLKLSKLNFEAFEVDRISVISYSYNESQGFLPFLKPEHSFELMKLILKSLKTNKKKQEFSMYLGSLSGMNLYRNISQNKLIGKSYAETLLDWYHLNWKEEWYIPKFLHEVVHDYPELKTRIDKNWGVGID